jgi:hypothetical protein
MVRSMPRNLAEPEARLRSHVQILAGLVGERNSSRPSALDATRAYLAKQVMDLGLQVIEHPYEISCRTAINLEVVIPGAKSDWPCLIVGAHYDTAPGTPGADDNASAVATLLEIIASLRTAPLRRTLRCIFYDCEEPPHFALGEMGSEHDARMRFKRKEAIHGMICLESIGYFPPTVPDSVHRPGWISWIQRLIGGRHLVIVSNLSSISFGFPFVLRFLTSGIVACLPAALPERIHAISLSDHRSYWALGYRALMVTDTAMFRNPNYHMPGDLPDTLDYPRMAKIAQILTRAIGRTCA